MPTTDRQLIDTLKQENKRLAESTARAKSVVPDIYDRVQVDRSGRVIQGWPGAKIFMWYMDAAMVDIIAAHDDVLTAVSATLYIPCNIRLRVNADAYGFGMAARIAPGAGEYVQFDIQYSSDGVSWSTIFKVDTNPLPTLDEANTIFTEAVDFAVEPIDSLEHPGYPIRIPAGYYLRLDVADITAGCLAAGVTVTLVGDVAS